MGCDMKVRVERMDEDGLARVRWCFELVSDWGRKDLFIEEFHKEHRETTRKKLWTKDLVYLRVGDMRPYRDEQKVASVDVPVPSDVEAEVRRQLVDFVMSVPITRKERR